MRHVNGCSHEASLTRTNAWIHVTCIFFLNCFHLGTYCAKEDTRQDGHLDVILIKITLIILARRLTRALWMWPWPHRNTVWSAPVPNGFLKRIKRCTNCTFLWQCNNDPISQVPVLSAGLRNARESLVSQRAALAAADKMRWCEACSERVHAFKRWFQMTDLIL